MTTMDGAISRRRLLGTSGVLGLSAVLATPAAAMASDVGAERAKLDGALGANFNQNLDDMRFRELEAARARWVRGFFTMPEADQGDPSDHVVIRNIVAASRRSYGTVLSLKFPLHQTPMPTPGSAAMETALARVDKVLPAVMDRVDILVIGNEPFVDSRPQDRDETLNVFYETVAKRVIDYRTARCGPRCKTHLYMGALNRLDLADRHTPAAERWMRFVRETPDIEGTDIHPHIPDPDATQAFLDYILPRMRPDQTFLVLEFSLIWYWKAHLSDPVSAQFADRYGFAPGTLVWQVIRAAIEHPFTQQQWDDFLSTCPWFESHKHFLVDQMSRFRATRRLAVATYGFRQDDLMVRNFGPDKVPWLLNSVFAPYTVQPRKDGTSGRGYAWIEDFRVLQRGRSDTRRT